MSAPLRISWVHPDVAEQIRVALRAGHASWSEVLGCAVAPRPEGVDVPDEAWPRLAEHIARAERVLEVVAQAGLPAAEMRFATSEHAVERATLLAASNHDDVAAVAGLLACPVDEWVAYGHFLSRLVELGAAADPAGTVAAFERFVAEASAVEAVQASWPERLRVARDGLAQLYVRVGRMDDAENLYQERFLEEPGDVTVAIGAARAFLEAGATPRAVLWLEHGSARADALGRADLRDRLTAKVAALRARLN